MVRRIAVDAMGGDFGPDVIIQGALAGARRFDASLLLVGTPSEIAQSVDRHDCSRVDVDVIEATDVIAMDEHPAQAVRRKPESSINVATRLILDGHADAMVSAGNSGAVMAGALMQLGRVKGIERPAIASYLPTASSNTLLLDLGAVTDPKPSVIVQFAVMGQVYAERVLRIRNPTIGLLSNGEEPSKGNALVQAVHPLLVAAADLNFVGNIEGKDLVKGTVDIVVTDGFTGNVALKTAEGVAAMLVDVLRAEITATIPRKLGGLLLRPAFHALRSKLDYAEIGGAPLLGVNGVVIISHGRSSAKAVENAVGVAVRSANHDLAGGIAERFAT
ncbi:MAG: phosphate acyltransferase PlsX [Chloroflexota bacterium]|nr:phosphate acyltransferase PlsX [Chloroflexota bacterium]